jgi:trehalose/maltose transport system substrate-binding protein
MRLLPILCLAIALLAACESREDSLPATPGTVVLRIAHDAVGGARTVNEKLAKEWEAKTGVQVLWVTTPNDASERLNQYQNFLTAHSADVDIYMADVVWAGLLGRHFADLKPAMGADMERHFPAIIANNTSGGALVLAPYYADAPMLYYRRDLLEKHGVAPPQTWDELEDAAKRIQDAERAAGSASFHGFVWQGRAYEGLTCNMLEWQVSSGAGAILDTADRPAIASPEFAAMLDRVRGWIGTISPAGVLNYAEEDARAVWQSGNAAFMRNWPYAYGAGAADDSPIRGKYAVTLLPAGAGGHAATLGGQMLAVSRYSKHQREAIDFVLFITSPEAQKRRALEGGYLPTRPELYDDAELAAAIPYLKEMRGVLSSAVPRPSTVAGRAYNELSAAYFTAGHRVLSGEAPAADALAKAAKEMEALLAGK